jgi:hypothetical protein
VVREEKWYPSHLGSNTICDMYVSFFVTQLFIVEYVSHEEYLTLAYGLEDGVLNYMLINKLFSMRWSKLSNQQNNISKHSKW